MSILAIDLGTSKTGVAFYSKEIQMVIPKKTISSTLQNLPKELSTLFSELSIDTLIVGLPLLPSGEKGSQANLVEAFFTEYPSTDLPTVHYVDERFTTTKDPHVDDNALAACTILQTWLEMNKNY